MHNLTNIQLIAVLSQAIDDGVKITVESTMPNVSWSGDVEALKEVHDRIQKRMCIILPDSVEKLRQ